LAKNLPILRVPDEGKFQKRVVRTKFDIDIYVLIKLDNCRKLGFLDIDRIDIEQKTNKDI